MRRILDAMMVASWILAAALIALAMRQHPQVRTQNVYEKCPVLTKRMSKGAAMSLFSFNGDSVHGMDYSKAGHIPGGQIWEYNGDGWYALIALTAPPPKASMGHPRLPDS